MINKHPRVSIGMPVYNGANYIREALDSFLNQTYENFEIIICDNASNDDTPEIAREYAERDGRIRFVSNPSNIGAAPNFNRTFELSTGEYFKWAAHDDVCDPGFLKTCVEVLDNDSTVVLCHPTEITVDAQGKHLKDYKREYDYPELKNTGSHKSYKRFYDLVCRRHLCFQIFGVMRADVLKMTPAMGDYIGADRNLLAELALFGRFYEVPDHIYFRRHEEQFCALQDASTRAEWFDPEKKGNIKITFVR